jgi:hypothetical protein
MVKSRVLSTETVKPVMDRPGYYYPEPESDDSPIFLLRNFLVNFECPDARRFDHHHGRTMFAC